MRNAPIRAGPRSTSVDRGRSYPTAGNQNRVSLVNRRAAHDRSTAVQLIARRRVSASPERFPFWCANETRCISLTPNVSGGAHLDSRETLGYRMHRALSSLSSIDVEQVNPGDLAGDVRSCGAVGLDRDEYLPPRDGGRAVDQNRPVHDARIAEPRPAGQLIRGVHSEDNVPQADAGDSHHLRRDHAARQDERLPERRIGSRESGGIVLVDRPVGGARDCCSSSCATGSKPRLSDWPSSSGTHGISARLPD